MGEKELILIRVLHGIYYVLRTGIQWDALPFVFGRPKTVYHWFATFSLWGFFDETWTYAIDKLQEKQALSLCHQSIDSTHRKALSGGSATGASPVDPAKPGSKIIIQTDATGLPIGLFVAASNRHDQELLKPTFLDTIKRIKRQQDSTFLHADRGFDSDSNAKFVKTFCMIRISHSRIYKKRKQTQTDILRDRYRWVVERTIS